MAHTVTYLQTESIPPAHRGQCKCGWLTGWKPVRQQAEDEGIAHEREMEQLRARMRTTPPSLSATRDYYREQAADENCSPENRVLWLRLADEIDRRLNDSTDPHEGQGTLL